MRYKQIVLATLVLFLTASCKKSYTCTCYEAYNPAAYEIKAVSKQKARDLCDSYDEPVWRTCQLTEGYFEKKKKK